MGLTSKKKTAEAVPQMWARITSAGSVGFYFILAGVPSGRQPALDFSIV